MIEGSESRMAGDFLILMSLKFLSRKFKRSAVVSADIGCLCRLVFPVEC